MQLSNFVNVEIQIDRKILEKKLDEQSKCTLIFWSKFDDFELPMTTNLALEGSSKRHIHVLRHF